MNQVYFERVETPVGAVWLLATGRGISSVRFETRSGKILGEIPPAPSRKELVSGGPIVKRAGRQILEYLNNKRRVLRIRVDLGGLSPFQAAVLRATRRIPYGETRTYAEIAARAGDPRATRPVQSILDKNPLPILVPCHRVVGAGGMGRYVGGREMKTRLIDMERGQMDLEFRPKVGKGTTC